MKNIEKTIVLNLIYDTNIDGNRQLYHISIWRSDIGMAIDVSIIQLAVVGHVFDIRQDDSPEINHHHCDVKTSRREVLKYVIQI